MVQILISTIKKKSSAIHFILILGLAFSTFLAPKTTLAWNESYLQKMVNGGTPEDFLKRDESGTSLLIWAFENWHTAEARALMARGAEITAEDELNEALLNTVATGNANLDLVQLLVEKGADVNYKNHEGVSPSRVAAKIGSLALVQFFIEKGVHINQIGPDGMTPLLWAAGLNNIDIVKLLIEKEPEISLQKYINIQSQNGDTALIWAAVNDNTDMVKLLLERKADTNLQNRAGDTALVIAAQHNNIEVVDLLIEKGTDVSHKTKRGADASRYTRSSKIKALLNSALIKQNLALHNLSLLNLAKSQNPKVQKQAEALLKAIPEEGSWLRRTLWVRNVKSLVSQVKDGKLPEPETYSSRLEKIEALMDHNKDPSIQKKGNAILSIKDPVQQEAELKNLENMAKESAKQLVKTQAEVKTRLEPLLHHQNDQIREEAEEFLKGFIPADFEKEVKEFENHAAEIVAQEAYKKKLDARLAPILTNPHPEFRERAKEISKFPDIGEKIKAVRQLEADVKRGVLSAQPVSQPLIPHLNPPPSYSHAHSSDASLSDPDPNALPPTYTATTSPEETPHCLPGYQHVPSHSHSIEHRSDHPENDHPAEEVVLSMSLVPGNEVVFSGRGRSNSIMCMKAPVTSIQPSAHDEEEEKSNAHSLESPDVPSHSPGEQNKHKKKERKPVLQMD